MIGAGGSEQQQPSRTTESGVIPMSNHLGVTVARMNGHLVHRPGSPVFHVYAGRLTPSGRWVPAAGRTVCNIRSGRLSVLERTGAVLDLDGRRMCGRCTARLVVESRRAVQPVNRDACLRFYAGVELRDLVTATALTTTVDETHRVGFVMGLLFGQAPIYRPAKPLPPNLSRQQAMFDLTEELLRRRRLFAAAERTPEEVEAAARKREDDAARDARILAERRKSDARDKVADRQRSGGYVTAYERSLLDSAS